FKVFDASMLAVSEGRNAKLLMEQNSVRTELGALIRAFVLEHNHLLDVERKHQVQYHQFANFFHLALRVLVVAGIVADITLSVTLAMFFGRSIATRLKSVMDNTHRLAAGEQLLPVLAGSDEIAVLDGVYHGMANTLKEARRRERAIVENALDVIC